MCDIQLYNEDCFIAFDHIQDKSIDCIICDLPYGTTNLSWDIVLPFDKLWAAYKRLLKPNGAVVLFASEPFTSTLICSNIKRFREKLTWVKQRPSNIGSAKYMHLKYSEDIVVFAKGRHTYNPQMQPRVSDRIRQGQRSNVNPSRRKDKGKPGAWFAAQLEPISWDSLDADWKYPGNVITIPGVVSNSKEKVSHPTQKPLKLLDYLVRTYSNEGDTILDNTMGSGTTGVSAVRNNRNFIGIEKEKEFFEIAKKRISITTPSLF